MYVRDIMTKPVATCSPETNLAAAVEILWNRDCGALPIVDSEHKVVGVITDRDICIALGTRNCLPSQITAADISSGQIVICKAGEDLRNALAMMAEARVRRLVVIDSEGKPEGILSIDDVVRRFETGSFKKDSGLSPIDFVNFLRRVYAPQRNLEIKHSIAAA